MTTLQTDIVLGEKYEDTITGIQGVATGVTFYLHACERVTLEFVKEGEVKWDSFDAPRMRHVESQKVASTDRTGGPGGREARRPEAPRR